MTSSEHGRRSLATLAGLLMLVVVVTGAASLYALHVTARSAEADLRRMGAVIAALDEARLAQVHFKKQVQEWKNLLLRGDDPVDRDRYLAAFEREADTVAAMLERIGGRIAATDVPPGRIAPLLREHAALRERYRTALAAASLEEPGGGRRTDAAVRGIDRDLTDAIDRLADDILSETTEIRMRMAGRMAARYEEMRNVVYAGLGIGCLLVLLVLAVAVRQIRSR